MLSVERIAAHFCSGSLLKTIERSRSHMTS